MTDFLHILSGVYLFFNVIMVYKMIEYISYYYNHVGFRVKHLALAIVFLPSTLFFSIIFGITILNKTIISSDFWNKRLF